jgi:hypothetical protein
MTVGRESLNKRRTKRQESDESDATLFGAQASESKPQRHY